MSATRVGFGLVFAVVVANGCLTGCTLAKDDALAGHGNALMTVADASEPSEKCPGGGRRVVFGADRDGNGLLDGAEVTGSTYVCDGLPGPAGASGVDGAKGTSGAGGARGVAGVAGLNGASGANGTNGVDGLNGADGTNGTNGTNGANGADGSNGANGANGYNALVDVTVEPPGTNCAGGGQRIRVGLDSDRSGALSPSEVSDTQFVCTSGAGLRVFDAENHPLGRLVFTAGFMGMYTGLITDAGYLYGMMSGTSSIAEAGFYYASTDCTGEKFMVFYLQSEIALTTDRFIYREGDQIWRGVAGSAGDYPYASWSHNGNCVYDGYPGVRPMYKVAPATPQEVGLETATFTAPFSMY